MHFGGQFLPIGPIRGVAVKAKALASQFYPEFRLKLYFRLLAGNTLLAGDELLPFILNKTLHLVQMFMERFGVEGTGEIILVDDNANCSCGGLSQFNFAENGTQRLYSDPINL